jgi:hypothetical protein
MNKKALNKVTKVQVLQMMQDLKNHIIKERNFHNDMAAGYNNQTHIDDHADKAGQHEFAEKVLNGIIGHFNFLRVKK